MRRNGVASWLATIVSRSAPLPRIIGVSIEPGATEFTLMPCSPFSIAAAAAIPSTARLLAPYAARPAPAR